MQNEHPQFCTFSAGILICHEQMGFNDISLDIPQVALLAAVATLTSD